MTKVLVAYASKHGATAEIAEAIAGALRDQGLDADCLEAGDALSLAPYDAAVVGSAVYMKRWRREARRFLSRHGAELAERPFWIFSSGPTGDPARDNAGWIEPAGIVARAEQLGVRGHVVFGGRVPLDPHGPAQRGMVKNTPPEYRDRRDWDAIRAWAGGIAAELATAAPAG